MIVGFWLAAAAAAAGATSVAPTVRATPPLSPAAGWASSYLLTSVLTTEYDAVLATLPPASPERRAFLTGDAGVALWTRAAFAVSAAKAKGQELPALPRLEALLAEQKLALAGAPPAILAAGRAAEQAGGAEAVDRETLPVSAGYAAVAQSFAAPGPRARWEKLAAAFSLPSPTCPISFDDVKSFAAHQRALLADGHGASPQALLQPIARWDLPKVQCLAFTLMAASPQAKANEGFEPLPLFQALQATGSPLARDTSLRALGAVRDLELARFSDALSALMDLTDVDESYRLPYEIVQRVFSIKQKGDGSVALQGL